jgi:hypothetical protein
VFRETGIEELRRLKERLVSQSDANRARLIADWQRLQSPDCWQVELFGLVRRHPAWTAALALGGGMLAARAVRRPGSLLGGIGRMGKVASVLFSVWRVIRRGRRQT